MVLVTSRLPLTDLAPWDGAGVRTLALSALTPAESTALLRAWGLSGDDGALAPLSAAAAGHALSLAMVGSYASAFLGGDPALAEGLLPSEVAGDDPLARRLTAVLAAYAARLHRRGQRGPPGGVSAPSTRPCRPAAASAMRSTPTGPAHSVAHP